MESIVWLFAIVSSALMFGLVCCVQALNYPLFLKVPRESFGEYHSLHLRNAGLLIAPAMMIELLSAGALFFIETSWIFQLVNLGGLSIVWISTFFVQVPLHKRLEQAWEKEAATKLIKTNWIRTLAWSFRFIFMIFWFLEI